MSDQKGHFKPEKIFLWLIIFTALEVGWGMAGKDWNKAMLWGGLGFFAFLKGWLIAVYFMHLKFEGWVVKSLMIPTPLLILAIYGYISPDISHSDIMDHPIGSMYDNESGMVQVDIGAHDGEESEAADE